MGLSYHGMKTDVTTRFRDISAEFFNLSNQNEQIYDPLVQTART